MQKNTKSGTTKTARRGRPRGPGGLTDALIERQDAMARRTARQINDVLDSHIPADVAAHVWAHVRTLIRARVNRIPGELTPEIMRVRDQGVEAVSRVMKEHSYQVLTDLANDQSWPEPLPPDPTLARAERCPKSKTLDEARARNAHLRARLIDLKERCV